MNIMFMTTQLTLGVIGFQVWCVFAFVVHSQLQTNTLDMNNVFARFLKWIWIFTVLMSVGCHSAGNNPTPKAAMIAAKATDQGRAIPENRRAHLGLPDGPVLAVHGLQPGIDLLVWLADLGKTNEYRTPAYSSLPDTDPYVMARGLDKGGIRLMSEGKRQVKEFVIPRGEIEALVRMRYDMDVVDWTDVIITRHTIVLVHTSYANAGMFTPSDVYVLPRCTNSFDYLNEIQAQPRGAGDDLRLIFPALLF